GSFDPDPFFLEWLCQFRRCIFTVFKYKSFANEGHDSVPINPLNSLVANCYVVKLHCDPYFCKGNRDGSIFIPKTASGSLGADSRPLVDVADALLGRLHGFDRGRSADPDRFFHISRLIDKFLLARHAAPYSVMPCYKFLWPIEFSFER